MSLSNISKQLNYVNNNSQKNNNKFVILHPHLLDSIMHKISGNAFKLYYILRSYSDSNYKAVFPSNKVLAAKLGCHVGSISRLLTELVDLGLIEIKKAAGNRNTYHFQSINKNVNIVQTKMLKQSSQFCEDLSNKNQESISTTTIQESVDVEDYISYSEKYQNLKIKNRAGLKKWISDHIQELDLTAYSKYLQRKNIAVKQKNKQVKSEFCTNKGISSDELMQFITQCKVITSGKKITEKNQNSDLF